MMRYVSFRAFNWETFFFFFPAFSGLLTVQLKSVTGNRVREGEWHAAKGPGPGVEPGSAAEPRHMGCALPAELSGAPQLRNFNQYIK